MSTKFGANERSYRRTKVQLGGHRVQADNKRIIRSLYLKAALGFSRPRQKTFFLVNTKPLQRIFL